MFSGSVMMGKVFCRKLEIKKDRNQAVKGVSKQQPVSDS